TGRGGMRHGELRRRGGPACPPRRHMGRPLHLRSIGKRATTMNRRQHYKTTVSAIVLGLVATTALAQTGQPETLQLTLADAVQRAVEHNPDLAIVRLGTEVDAARVSQSRGVYSPVFSTTL